MKKTIVITGGSDGIGKAAAAALTAQDHDVIIVGRNREKTQAAAKDLGIPCFIADFAHLDDVRKLAHSLAGLPQIDVLANNAGGIQGSRHLTEDGFESTLQINHLAPFLLTNLLLPQLIANNATVINTASAANLRAKINLDDLNLEHGYSNFKAYANSKLMNILFTNELNHRHYEDGIRTVAFHPGVIATNFGNGAGLFVRTAYHTPLKNLFGFKTSEEGAAQLIRFASTTAGDQTWHPGNYYSNGKPGARTAHQGHDLTLAHQLWERSKDMVGLNNA